MESSCRLCGTLLEGIRINIFESDSDYVKKIHKILPITVNECDPFPKNMCHRCYSKVNDFYEFRINAIKAEELFKSQIPWLRDKKGSAGLISVNQPPMVRLPISMFDAISPAERGLEETAPAASACPSPICIDDDSPPPSWEGDSETSYTILNNHSRTNDNVLRIQKKSKKNKKRSIWDTKQRRRKKKQQENLNITEVFTTGIEHQYETFENEYSEPENDPLGISPESENSDQFEEDKTETPEVPKLPKYVQVMVIPGVADVYTCEKCGRTMLTRDAAIKHECTSHSNSQSRSQPVPVDRPQTTAAAEVPRYACDSCDLSFTRRSQLASHTQSHYVYDSSSDERSTVPPVKRRRKSAKKKSKRLSPEPLSPNVNNNAEHHSQSYLNRNLILSSDSN